MTKNLLKEICKLERQKEKAREVWFYSLAREDVADREHYAENYNRVLNLLIKRMKEYNQR